jgi:DNA-binding GntR family transcriptional regulator
MTRTVSGAAQRLASDAPAGEPAETARAPMLRDRAYVEFKRRLFLGHLRPGQFISQRELTLFLGLPLAAVRDAVKRLEAQGLVRVIPQRGIAVAEVNLALVRESFELRRALETYAARRCAKSGDKASLRHLGERMAELLAASRRGAGADVLEAALETDWRLHEQIVAALDNEIYRTAYQDNFDRIRLIRLNREFTLGRLEVATAEHLAIIAALCAGDAEEAARAVERHLDTSFRNAIGLEAPAST